MKWRHYKLTSTRQKVQRRKDLIAALKSRLVWSLLVSFAVVYGVGIFALYKASDESVLLVGIGYLMLLAAANFVMNAYELAKQLRNYRFVKY